VNKTPLCHLALSIICGTLFLLPECWASQAQHQPTTSVTDRSIKLAALVAASVGPSKSESKSVYHSTNEVVFNVRHFYGDDPRFIVAA